MKVNEVFVSRENPTELFSVIEKELSARPNTQVFVDQKVYEELRWKRSDLHVSSPNYVNGFHYHTDRENGSGGPTWLELYKPEPPYKGIARGSFIGNCKGYMQLVEFHSQKVKEYIHYLVGFNQLLLVRFKPASKA